MGGGGRAGPSGSLIIKVPEVQIQGRQRDLDRLINGLLLSHECRNNSNVTMIPVVGGIGKTTLARHVYNNPGIREHFKLRGWVCVSEDFHEIQLTRMIIESFTGTSCDRTELGELLRRLMEVVKGNRFLLVLDDADRAPWVIRWDILQQPLGATGSAVITTIIRPGIEATFMQTVPFHRLEGLCWDDCWAIFQRYAFRGALNRKDSEELAEIGRKIVLKCKGVPLAVQALGSMLYYEPDAGSWEDVVQSEVWEMILGDRDGGILPALMLCYQYLPPHLKPCLLYCSLFPKGYRFHKDELVLLWMAQGYIQAGEREEVEVIAATYADELVQRSFFEYHDLKDTSTFVMHDHIHDLAQSISPGEYRRINNMDMYDRKHKMHSLALPTARHLSIVAATGLDVTMVLDSQFTGVSARGNPRTLRTYVQCQ